MSASERQSGRPHLPMAAGPFGALLVEQGHGKIRFANPRFEELTGWTATDLPDVDHLCERAFSDPTLRRTARDRLVAEVQSPTASELVVLLQIADGSTRTVCLQIVAVESDEVALLWSDITEQVAAAHRRYSSEERVRRVERAESLAALAGGVAHDFNNLLVGILGNVELAMLDLPPGSPTAERLRAVQTVAVRARGLATQMLAYSGRARANPEPTDLNQLVKDLGGTLRPSTPKGVQLELDLAPDLPPVQGDISQLRDVVLNLVSNASDALSEAGGSVVVSTTALHCSREELASTYLDDQLPDGRYVSLEIRDDGPGMADDVRGRIFEPFYSTKVAGRGVGLAAVLGIVRSHGGAITVQSAPGHGTSFRVLLPTAAAARRAPGPATAAPVPARPGQGTLLLVDDEELVRDVAAAMLRELGYEVIVAVDGAEAVRIFKIHGPELAGVILDRTMPGLSGEQTFLELRSIDPDVKVVICSGYSETELHEQLAGERPAGFLAKPFTFAQLADTLSGALHS